MPVGLYDVEDLQHPASVNLTTSSPNRTAFQEPSAPDSSYHLAQDLRQISEAQIIWLIV